MFRILQHYLILADQCHWLSSIHILSASYGPSLRDFYAQLPANGAHFASGPSFSSTSSSLSDCQRPRCIFHWPVSILEKLASQWPKFLPRLLSGWNEWLHLSQLTRLRWLNDWSTKEGKNGKWKWQWRKVAVAPHGLIIRQLIRDTF